jgi:hypothetical protein
MDEKIKKIIRIYANTKSAFTRLERFADNSAVDPKPEHNKDESTAPLIPNPGTRCK